MDDSQRQLSLSKTNIITFNCSGIKSSREYICNFLSKNMDIIALQETWLMPHEISLPDSLSEDFEAFSISSVNVDEKILRGRPYGGLTFLWHKKLSQRAQIVKYDDDRLLGLLISYDELNVLFLNVYLPDVSNDNGNDEFMFYLGKILSIASDPEVDAICILGDFNAGSDTVRLQELMSACLENDLVVADMEVLPPDSYTHANNNNISFSWLDHAVLSRNILH